MSAAAIARSIRERVARARLFAGRAHRSYIGASLGAVWTSCGAALAHVLAGAPTPEDIGKPRLAVDRVFTLRGVGTVVTGTLSGGALRRGQEVTIQPSGKTTRIRNMQSHSRSQELCGPGTRVALNLPDLDALADIRRGDVITLGELGGATETADVLLEISPRAARSIKNASRVNVHYGSAKNPGARWHFLHGRRHLHPVARRVHSGSSCASEAPAFLFAADALHPA